jgi:membrane-bound lytic murein transglycosylase D
MILRRSVCFLAPLVAAAACSSPLQRAVLPPTPVAPPPATPVQVPSAAVMAEAAAMAAASAEEVRMSAGAALVSPEEVARQATTVFGAATDPVAGDGIGPAGPSADAAVEAPTWDMDVQSFASHDRVSHYVDLFTGPARERIQERLSRGTRYEPMIRRTMREAGLPEDLYYLAMVESGFNPDAYSRAAAVGMWQFMTSTARGMGLRVDQWVDERRDPVRATQAAARFIGTLRDQFGSLYLAAAAYNGGPGRIARGLRRHEDDLDGATGDSLFFALASQRGALRAETANYVPQIIAAALLGKEPVRYGIAIDTQPAFAYDSVSVPAMTPLAAVASAAGVATADVQALNPHLLRGMTPPKGAKTVRVPAGTGEGFDARFDALDAEVRRATRTLTTKQGETRATFARRAGIPVEALTWLGAGPARYESGRLKPGQKVVVPTPAVVAAARDVPNPSIERYGGTVRGVKTHVVRRGESLSVIARRYGLSVNRLKEMNRLQRSVIVPGQRLVVQ